MKRAWIVSAPFDLALFSGPALLSLLLVAPALLGVPLPEDGDTPLWAWLLLVVGVDVAHVWASLYRVYLDPAERKRRPLLYFGTPLAVGLGGLALASISTLLFWRVMAYVAAYHFIKQQVGFVALYRLAEGTRDLLDRRLDTAAVWVGTGVPLLWWHCHLPRSFAWFMPGDFIAGMPGWLFPPLWIVYVGVGVVWVGRQLTRRVEGLPLGRIVMMAATWTTWGVGIVALDFDYTFTATNVLLHGVAYVALVWHTTRARARDPQAPPAPALQRLTRRRLLPAFVGVLLALALVEEGLWDLLVWREHLSTPAGLEAALESLPGLGVLATALLSVPQVTHYILDGFIWRMDGSNPGLRGWVEGGGS